MAGTAALANAIAGTRRSAFEWAACGACGCGQSRFLFEARDYLYGNPGAWPVAECLGCGVVFLNPRVSPDAIGALYPPSYYTNAAAGGSGGAFGNALRDYVVHRLYRYPLDQTPSAAIKLAGGAGMPFFRRWSAMRKHVPFAGGGSLLDVGCGNGKLLARYKRYGWNTHGVEPSPSSAAIAQRGGHVIHPGDLFQAGLPADRFDAVTLWDALEHIHNPRATLAEIYRVLKPGGHVYLSVPNFGSGYARLLRDRWFMFTAPLHYYHYTRATLSALLDRCGYQAIDVSTPLGDAGIGGTLRILAGDGPAGRLLHSRVVRRLLAAADLIAPAGHLFASAEKRSV